MGRPHLLPSKSLHVRRAVGLQPSFRVRGMTRGNPPRWGLTPWVEPGSIIHNYGEGSLVAVTVPTLPCGRGSVAGDGLHEANSASTWGRRGDVGRAPSCMMSTARRLVNLFLDCHRMKPCVDGAPGSTGGSVASTRSAISWPKRQSDGSSLGSSAGIGDVGSAVKGGSMGSIDGGVCCGLANGDLGRIKVCERARYIRGPQ